MNVTYEILKKFVQTRFLSVQSIDLGDAYALFAIDGPLILQCTIHKEGEPERVADYEETLAPTANIPSMKLPLV